MVDFFGRKKKAKEKHEKELRERLASKLVDYDLTANHTLSQFTEIDFGKGKVKVKKITIKDDTWEKSNPSDINKKSS